MPKAKPDQVVVHRIELQEREREMIEEYMKPKVVQNWAIAAGVGTVCVGVGMAGYAAYWFLTGVGETAERIASWWDGVGLPDKPVSADMFKKDPDKPGYAKDGTPTNIFGLPGWGIWPGVI